MVNGSWFMADGSWLTAQGLWPMAQGSWLKAHGQERGARVPGPGPGPGPWGPGPSPRSSFFWAPVSEPGFLRFSKNVSKIGIPESF